MLSMRLPFDKDSSLNILCLGAHADDIEIGCGGTILHLARAYPKCNFNWVVFSAEGARGTEARHAASLFAGMNMRSGPLLNNFKDGFMPFDGALVKAAFENLKAAISPDLILTHYLHDAHQDHRLVAELTWNTFRDHMILEYEIPKYDGDVGQPTFFVPLALELCELKVEHLLNAFKSQQAKRWFCREVFFSVMRLRGVECNAPSGYAEAFYCRKVAI